MGMTDSKIIESIKKNMKNKNMKNKFIITIDTPTILKIANKTWKEINFFYQNATSNSLLVKKYKELNK